MELRIKELCEAKGETLTSLANKTGIARETLSRRNNQKTQWNPSLKTLERIAEVLEVDITDLFEPTKTTNLHSQIIGSVRVGDRIHLIDSIHDLEKLLEELKGGQQ